MSTPLAARITEYITKALPGAVVSVHDPDGAHLSATVTSTHFNGLSRIQQHRLVYQALGNAFEDDLHALQLTTQTPKE